MTYFLTDFIGKVVLNAKGDLLGYCVNVTLDKRCLKIKNLICVNSDEEEFLTPYTAILSLGDGAIIVKSRILKPLRNDFANPLFLKVYSIKGNYLGELINFECENNLINRCITANFQFLPSQIIKINDNIFITEETIKSVNTVKPQENNDNETKVFLAGKNILNGRKTIDDIYNSYNALIIPKGTIITPEVVSTALKHNKLFELTIKTLSSK